MSDRELTILGSSAMTPTRERNHNGYLLQWDDQQLLFDPGEGTQRQLQHAGKSAARISRIFITHFHGDHCLGLPGIIQRLSLDRVAGPVDVHFPVEGEMYYDRLRGAAVFHERRQLRPHACTPGVVVDTPAFTVTAHALDHRIPTLGWRLQEPDGRRMVPELLERAGLSGPVVGELQRTGTVTADGRRVTVEEVSAPRPGQRFAFIMDTALCDAAFELAAGADLVVCESTYLSSEEELARSYKHLTAAQAARIAAEAGARRLVLTHLSQRYGDAEAFLQEARAVFDDVVVAHDLARVPVPARVDDEHGTPS